MKLATIQPVLAAILALNLGIGQAASPAIGTALTKGSFRLNNATVTGNATLLEGSTIETSLDSSSLELSGGARVILGSGSKGRIFGDHLMLERGEGRIEKPAGFRVETRGLTIQPETGSAIARVVLANSQVRVASIAGSSRVLNSSGAVVALLPPGVVLAFEPQVSSAATRITGRLVSRGGHYLITDETTHVTVEVTGTGLEKQVGRRVQVSGTSEPAATPVSDASQVIRVTSIQRLPAPGTAAAGSGGVSGGGAAISGTAIAIIGGVAAAAVVGGLAAAGGLPGQGGSASVSR